MGNATLNGRDRREETHSNDNEGKILSMQFLLLTRSSTADDALESLSIQKWRVVVYFAFINRNEDDKDEIE